jgi:hypothetical protein
MRFYSELSFFLISLLFVAPSDSGAASPPPTLSANLLANHQLQLSWPSSAVGFVLEQAGTLGAGADWSTFAPAPQLVAGQFSVTIDAGARQEFYRLHAALVSVRASSPLDGETGVAVTRETIVYFSAPLAASATVTSNNFYAGFGGRRILSRIELSSDHTKASLFYLEPLPGSAHISVVFDGTGLTDDLGQAIDPDGDGNAGGMQLFGFDTLNLTALVNTGVIGTVYASELVPGGDTGTNAVNKPLAGVTITVDGMEESLRAVTDASGNFTLNPAPPGRFFVHIDGRTITNVASGIRYPDQSYYPYVGKAWDATAGKTNNLAGGTGTIFLPLIKAGTLQPVSMTEDTAVSFPASVVASNPALAGTSINVPANSLFNDNGTRGGKVGLAPVPPDRLPGPLPPGAEVPIVITVQTDGALNFDKPAPVCFPNLPNPTTGKAWPAGTKGSLISFNHKKGVWEPIGDMTVSADGSVFCTDPGVGILQPGWHSVECPKAETPPPPVIHLRVCQPGNIPKEDACRVDCGTELEKENDFIVAMYRLLNRTCKLAHPTDPDLEACFDAFNPILLHAGTLLRIEFEHCVVDCQQCFGPEHSSGNSVSSPRSHVIRASASNDPIASQISSLCGRALDLLQPYLSQHLPVPAAVRQQSDELLDQADTLAGGDSEEYLRSAVVRLEEEAATKSAAAGIDLLDLNPGNAPAYPVLYAAVVARPAGPFILRGQTGPFGQYSLFLPPDGSLAYVSFFDPKTRNFGVITPNLSQEAPFPLPRFTLSSLPPDTLDFDHDGLPDLVEQVVGTDPTNPDTDSDGIPDGAEIDQGTDPLDGFVVTTGVIATTKTLGAAIDIWTGNEMVATAEGASGVSILSVYNGSNPTVLAHVPTPFPAVRVAGAGTSIVVATSSELEIIDASTPALARIIHQIRFPAAQAITAITAGGGTAWAGADSGQILAVNLLSGVVSSSIILPAGVGDLALEGDYLYALTGDHLYVISLANSGMALISSVLSPFVAAPNQRLFVGGGIAYTVHRKGYNAIDLSDPTKPVLLTAGETTQFGWKQIIANGSGLGLAAVGPNSVDDGPHDISVYDLSDPKKNAVFITTLSTPGIARAVSIYNGLAYVADDTAGVEVLNYLPYDNKRVSPAITLASSLTASGVEEGKPARASATVVDDVQVRNVEFYLDGVKTFTDAAFPFEFRFITPSRSAGKTNFTLRARAVDTGGNFIWSGELNVPLVPDATPPQIIRVVPASAGKIITTVLAFFDEAINPTTVNEQTFQLFSAGADGLLGTRDDLAIPGEAVSYTAETRSVSLSFAQPLPEKAMYRGVVKTAVADLAGNRLATDYTWDFRTVDAVFFSSFEGGPIAPAGTTLNGSAVIEGTGGVNNSGVLKLTKTIGNQTGSFVIDDFSAGAPVYGYDFTAKVRVGGGTSVPADGFSISFDPLAGPNTNPTQSEVGTSSGVSVAFDIYKNGNENPPAPSINLKFDGVVVATHLMSVADFDTGDGFADLQVILSADGTFSLTWKGSSIFRNVVLPAFQPLSGARFVIAARTGGLNENQWFDDLNIATFTTPTIRITQQPSSLEVLSGRTVGFSVAANSPDVTFQWFKNGAALAGATASSLNVPNVTIADSGTTYKVVVTGPNNTVTSDEATLTVLDLNPQLDFNFNDGQLPAGTQIFSTMVAFGREDPSPGTTLVDSVGGVGNSGALKLMNVVNLAPGARFLEGKFLIAPLLGGTELSGVTASFNVRIGGGTVPPAEGFSFNFAPALPNDAIGIAEEGVGQGLSITFDIFDNGNETPPAPSIDVKYKGKVIASTHLAYQDIVTGNDYRPVLVRWSADGRIDLAYGDRLLFAGLPLPNYTFVKNGMFGFFARTFFANENIWIDNLKIEGRPSNAQ